MKAIRLVSLDVDGTLVDWDTPELQDQDRDAILSAKRNALIVLNTGRSLEEAQPLIQQLGLQPDYLVLGGGGVILDQHEREIVCAEFDNSSIADVLNFVGAGYDLVVGFAKQGWINWETRGMDETWSAISLRYPSLQTGQAALAKIVAAQKPFHANLVTDAEDRSKVNLLLSPPATDKGAGLRAVFTHSGVTSAEAMAVGDMPIDIPMFRAVAISFAMGNALPEVKQVASHVTGSVQACGVAQALKKLGLA